MKNSNTDWIEALQGALICAPDKVPADYLSIEQLQQVFKNKQGKPVSGSQVRKRIRALVKDRRVEPKVFNILAGGNGRLRNVTHYKLVR